MNKYGVGALLCSTSAIIYAMKFLATAFFVSNTMEWSKEIFQNGLDYVGNELTVVLAVVGIVYLIIAEIETKTESEFRREVGKLNL